MPLAAGDRAPDFTLPDETGAPVSLADFAGTGVVVYFYPKAFTPGCTTQACDLRDRHDAITAAGYEVLGISPDVVPVLARFRVDHRLPFRMLSDPDHTVAAAFGVWGTKKNYGREYTGIIRSTFVIGPDGTIVEAMRNVKATGHGDRLVGHLA